MMKNLLEDKKGRKNAKIWIDTEHLQNQKIHTQKNSRTSVYNMTVFYFLTKVSGPFQGGRGEGNDDILLFCRERSYLYPLLHTKRKMLVCSFAAQKNNQNFI